MTTEETRQAAARRYAEMKAEHRCTTCGKKHKTGYRHVRCMECRELIKIKRCTGAQEAKRKRLDERIAFIVSTAGRLTAMKQAQALAIPVNTVYFLRNAARRRGHEVIRDYGGALRFKESTKWDRLEEEMATGCGRCGLRGDHDCIPLRADPWQRKGGPSYPEPGGCTFTRAEKAHMGKVESKFVRFTNAKRDAARGAR